MSEPIDLDQFAGFTPGPWTWQGWDAGHFDHEVGRYEDPPMPAMVIAGEDGTEAEEYNTLAYMAGPFKYMRYDDVQDANARLMAAAPALLAEVRSLRARLAAAEGRAREGVAGEIEAENDRLRQYAIDHQKFSREQGRDLNVAESGYRHLLAYAALLLMESTTKADGSPWTPAEAVAHAKESAYVNGITAPAAGWSAGDFADLLNCRDAVKHYFGSAFGTTAKEAP